MLRSVASPRFVASGAHFVLSQIQSQLAVATFVRYQSGGGWIAPKRRGKPLPATTTAASSRRPLLANGQPVAFHVNDLKQQQQQQQQQQRGVSNTNDYYSTGPSLFGNPSNSSFAAAQSTKNKNHASSPPSKRRYESDLIVVLDMDECLIHSEFLQNPLQAAIYAHQLKQRRQEQHQHHHPTINHNNNNHNQNHPNNLAAPCDSFRIALPDGDLVHVHLRPGVLPFLRHVTSRYETHIFTAGMPVYAKPILDYLCSAVRTNTVHEEHHQGSSVFAGRWYREHCTWDEQRRQFVKDLSKLALSGGLHKTVLVDNNPDSFHANPENGILVNSFYDDARDDTLAAVTQVLAELEGHADVRPVLSERFQLARAIQSPEQTHPPRPPNAAGTIVERDAQRLRDASVVQFVVEDDGARNKVVASSSSPVPPRVLTVSHPKDSLLLQDVQPQVACFA